MSRSHFFSLRNHSQKLRRLAVALVITIPSTYFALQPRSAPHSGDHGHGSHDEHSTESHEVKSEDEGKEEKSDDGETEEKSEDTDEKSDDKDENKDAGDDEGQKDADAKDSAAGSEKSGESKKSEGGKVSFSICYPWIAVTNACGSPTEVKPAYGRLVSAMSFGSSA